MARHCLRSWRRWRKLGDTTRAPQAVRTEEAAKEALQQWLPEFPFPLPYTSFSEWGGTQYHPYQAGEPTANRLALAVLSRVAEQRIPELQISRVREHPAINAHTSVYCIARRKGSGEYAIAVLIVAGEGALVRMETRKAAWPNPDKYTRFPEQPEAVNLFFPPRETRPGSDFQIGGGEAGTWLVPVFDNETHSDKEFLADLLDAEVRHVLKPSKELQGDTQTEPAAPEVERQEEDEQW